MQLAEAGFSMTENAMGDLSARFAKDDHLFVKFHTQPLHNQKKSAEAGRPIYDDREYVSIMVPGDKCSIIDRPASPEDIQRFPKHYERFKTNAADQSTGTPLEHWPSLTRSQVEEMKYFGVHTVEQLAGMADTQTQQFRGMNTLRTKAQQFLDAAADNAVNDRLNAELADRDNQIAALMQAVEDLKTKVTALED